VKWGACVLRVRSVSREEVWASAGVPKHSPTINPNKKTVTLTSHADHPSMQSKGGSRGVLLVDRRLRGGRGRASHLLLLCCLTWHLFRSALPLPRGNEEEEANAARLAIAPQCCS